MERWWLLGILLAGCGASSDFIGGSSPNAQVVEAPAVLPRGTGGVATDPSVLAGLPKTLAPALINAGFTPKVTEAPANLLSPVLDQGYLESCGGFGLAYAAPFTTCSATR